MKELTGYRRTNDRAGIRNHILVLPTVVCANSVVEALDRIYSSEIVAVKHPYGCTFDPVSNEEITKTFIGLALNPNVFAVLLVGLGCETVKIDEIYEAAVKCGAKVEKLIIQENGGTKNTVEKACPLIDGFLEERKTLKREPISFEDLIVGTECGASDSYSGLSANPALGKVADMIIEQGGTVFLTELTEFIGAEEILYEQCIDQSVAGKLKDYLEITESDLGRVGSAELRDIAPGNIAGGLTTLEEKSLGCIKKGGSTMIREVVGHGERPVGKGLVVMDAPGHDVESMIAMLAGGAQVIFFTTGRGTPTGTPIAPVIKVSSNTAVFHSMGDNIDVNAGTIIEGAESTEEAARRMFDFLVEVVNGRETKSEVNVCREFAIRRRGVGTCIL